MNPEDDTVAIDVTLTPIEMQHAAMIGALRQIEATRRRLQNKFGADPDNGWTLNIEGAAGELAVAKLLNRYWGMPVNTFRHGGDVGQLQVRTRSRHDYELIIRAHDRDTDIFVLVTGQSPHFKVHGYIFGAQAKQERWLANHGGRPAAYFVPRSALHPIKQLNVALNERLADASTSTYLRAS